MRIEIYSKNNCPNCVTAKKLLDSKGIGYTEIDIEENKVLFGVLLSQYPQARQMPQIFIEGKRVGGLNGMQAALSEMGL